MIFNELSEDEKEAVAYVLTEYSDITHQKLISMNNKDQSHWISFCYLLAFIHNKRADIEEKNMTDYFLRKLNKNE